VPGSLVAAAVLTLGKTTTAHAAVACGTPGSHAVYETLDHPAVYTTVPAVTHREWRWTRQVPTSELEYSRTVSEGCHLVTWSRSTDVLDWQLPRRRERHRDHRHHVGRRPVGRRLDRARGQRGRRGCSVRDSARCWPAPG